MLKVGQKLKDKLGYRVEVLAVLSAPDCNGYSVVALPTDSEGTSEVVTYKADGRFMMSGPSSCCCLVLTPPIETRFVNPPIPDRRCDWCAWYSDADEEGPRGWGPSEAEAIADLEATYPCDEAEAA